ncbi:MAG: hypothetical protein AAB074_10775 [Planctomycetota bacterium]|mgnify:CR=1 FL=1
MGLDVFVMPISAYLAGRFESPLAQVLGSAAAANVIRVGNPKPDAAPDLAAEHLAWMQAELTRLTGRTVAWRDAGETVFSRQYHYGSVQAVRALAASVEYPNLSVDAAGKPLPVERFDREHPALVHVYRGAATKFPHLIWHADNQGYYVPCDFPEPVKLGLSPLERAAQEKQDAEDRAFYEQEAAKRKSLRWKLERLFHRIDLLFRPAKEREFHRLLMAMEDVLESPSPADGRWDWVGSSIALLRELEVLRSHAGVERDWNGLPDETLAEESDPFRGLKYAWAFLHKAGRESVANGLPIVFDG